MKEQLTIESAYELGYQEGKKHGPASGSQFIMPEEHIDMHGEPILANYLIPKRKKNLFVRLFRLGYMAGAKEYINNVK